MNKQNTYSPPLWRKFLERFRAGRPIYNQNGVVMAREHQRYEVGVDRYTAEKIHDQQVIDDYLLSELK